MREGEEGEGRNGTRPRISQYIGQGFGGENATARTGADRMAVNCQYLHPQGSTPDISAR